MKTTLNRIRSHDPCTDSWLDLLRFLGKAGADDEPLEITTILQALSLDDALWALRAVDGFDREIRLLACDYAEHVLENFEKEFPGNNAPRNTIEVARRFANGEATTHELAVACSGAVRIFLPATMRDDADHAVWSALWSADLGLDRGSSDTAWIAAESARDSAEDSAAEAEWQTEQLIKTLENCKHKEVTS